MTHDELRDTIGRLGLSQVRVAQCIGIDPRVLRRWLAGENPIPEPVARILRLAAAGRVSLEEMREA